MDGALTLVVAIRMLIHHVVVIDFKLAVILFQQVNEVIHRLELLALSPHLPVLHLLLLLLHLICHIPISIAYLYILLLPLVWRDPIQEVNAFLVDQALVG